MMRAVGGRRITQEPAVHQVRVEPCGQLVVGPLHDGGDIRLEVVDERDHVDHGLGRKPGNGGGADVVDL